jgi:hypothetical protein
MNVQSKTRGIMWDGPKDHEATARDLARWVEEYGQGLGYLAMVHKPDGELVGHCGLTEGEGRSFSRTRFGRITGARGSRRTPAEPCCGTDSSSLNSSKSGPKIGLGGA